MTMFGINSLAHFEMNISLTLALLAFFVGWIIVKIFGLNINEFTMTWTLAITIYVLVWGTRYWVNSKRRNVIYMKRQQFFQLVKLSMDISTEVLRKLMDSKILSDAKYKGLLHKFLDDKKNYLYHQWQGSIPCCECTSEGCTLRKSENMKDLLFKKLYKHNPLDYKHNPQDGKYPVDFKGHRIPYCLECFEQSPDLTTNCFDLTDLSFFINHFAHLTSKEHSSLKAVVDVRYAICNLRNTNSVQPKELKSLWIKLSDALLTLTDSQSRTLLKEHIIMIKKVEFDSTDIKELEEKVEHEREMLEETCQCMNKNGVTKGCMNTQSRSIHDDVKAMSNQIGILQETVNDIKMEIHVLVKMKGIPQNDASELSLRTIRAVAQIDDDNIDEKSVVENITKSCDTDDKQGKFKVLSAKQSCVILYLECSSIVLKSEHLFRSAVKSLLSDIVQAGNIDTSIPLTLVLQLIFSSPLTKDEINMIKNVVERERDTTKVSLSQGVQKIQKKFEVYKISSFKSQVLEITKKDGIIILTEESHIPAEADVEVRLWGDSNFYLALPVKVVKNAIEFEIPWDKILHGNQLQISVFDKQMQIETSKIKFISTYQYKIDNKLKLEYSSTTCSAESDFRSDREDDYLEKFNPFPMQEVQSFETHFGNEENVHVLSHVLVTDPNESIDDHDKM